MENKIVEELDFSNHPLYKVNPDDIPLIPYKDEIIDARVVDVYDGDTCTILYSNQGVIVKEKIRVLGIDTPEKVVKGERHGTPLGELEERAAEHVQQKVEKLLLDKLICVKRTKFDKFGGRHNGELYFPLNYEWGTLTEYLDSNKYGKVYTGKKKEPWTEEELEYILNN